MVPSTCLQLALSTTEFVSRAAPHAAIANLLRAGQPKGSRSEDPRHDSHRRPESTSGAGLQRVPDSTKTGDTVDHHPHFRPGAGHLATSNDSFVREGPLASLFCGKRKRGRSIDEGQSEEGRGRLMGGAFAGSKKSALESFGGSDMRADDCEGASRRVVEHGVDDIDVPATKPSVSVDASESPGRLRAPEPPGRLVASGRGRRWRKQTRALLAEVFGTDDSACDLVSSAETSEGVQGGQTRSTGADILKGHLSVTGVAGGDGRAGGSGSDEEGEDVEGFWCDILGAGWGRDGEEEVEEGIVDGVGHSGGNDEADDEASKQRDGWGHSGGNEGLGTRDEEEGREYGRTDGCASEVPVHRGVGGERMRRQGIRDLWASHMAREGGDATRRCDSATRQAVRNQGAGGGGGEAKNGTLYMLFKRAKESMPVHVKTEAGAWVDVSGRSGGARWCARREEGEKETRYWTGGDNGGGRERGEAKRDGHDGNRNMPSGDDQNFAEEVGSLADELGVDLREQRLILADLEHQRKIDTICALGRSKQGRDGRAHQGAGVSKQKGGRWGGHGGSVVAMLQQVARRPGIDGKAVEEGDIPDFGHNP